MVAGIARPLELNASWSLEKEREDTSSTGWPEHSEYHRSCRWNLKPASTMALRQLHGGEGLASYSRESFTTVATNAGGAIGYKLRPVLQAQLSSGQGFTDLCSLGHALPDSATAVGPWDSISATGGSGRRVGLVQQAELIRATLEMDPSLSVPAILREAALLVGTEPEGPLLVQVCRARPLRTPCGLPPLCTPLHASARPFRALGRRGGCSIASALAAMPRRTCRRRRRRSRGAEGIRRLRRATRLRRAWRLRRAPCPPMGSHRRARCTSSHRFARAPPTRRRR